MAADRPAVITWDWRSQPDIADLADAIRRVSGGQVHIRAAHTGSDEYALVIADRELDDAEAQRIYDRWEATDGR